MREFLGLYPKCGCPMLIMKLKQLNFTVNHKKVERLYKLNKMQLRNRRTKKKYIVQKQSAHILSTVPGKWFAIDFVIDSVRNSRPLKVLTVIDPDPVTNEVPVIKPDFQ